MNEREFLEHYLTKWFGFAKITADGLDKDLIKNKIKKLYAFLGLDLPQHFLFFDNPVDGLITMYTPSVHFSDGDNSTILIDEQRYIWGLFERAAFYRCLINNEEPFYTVSAVDKTRQYKKIF